MGLCSYAYHHSFDRLRVALQTLGLVPAVDCQVLEQGGAKDKDEEDSVLSPRLPGNQGRWHTRLGGQNTDHQVSRQTDWNIAKQGGKESQCNSVNRVISYSF